MNILIRVVLIVLTILLAIGIGLLLRRALLRRLKKTVLDNWIVQALGILVIFPPLLLAGLAAPIIWDTEVLTAFWNVVRSHIPEITNTAWSIVESLLILVFGVGIARTVMTLTIRGLGENRIDVNIRTLIGRIFYVLILVVAFFWILSIWQISSIGVPVAVIGVMTVALTVAVQDILKDLVAGFYLLLERPFHIGDQINTASYTGKVEDVQLRATKLRLLTGEQVTIPNALVFSGTVINDTYYGEKRATITIKMDQDEFVKDETFDTILKTLKEIDNVMPKPEPVVLLSSYEEKRVTLLLHFWIAIGQIFTFTEVMQALHEALPNADLSVQEGM
jgi:small-conductance mechanosensitive channel